MNIDENVSSMISAIESVINGSDLELCSCCVKDKSFRVSREQMQALCKSLEPYGHFYIQLEEYNPKND